jgi:chemotaxis protein MotB
MKGKYRANLLLPVLGCVLLGGCVSQKAYDALQTQDQELQQRLTAAQQQVAAQQVQIARLEGAIKYSVNSDLLFHSGSWQLSPAGEDIMAKMAKMLAPGMQGMHEKLLVSGYTDNAAIGPVLQRRGVTSNEELSQKRADAVMAYLVSHGVTPDLVAAKGFGETEPLASNNTVAGRAQNRRVEITVAPAATS